MAIATPIRLDHVQALRGLAAGLVLVSHLLVIEGRTAARPILPDSLDWGKMGVDLFFVISGFIMVFITRDFAQDSLRDRAARLPHFLFARAARIYPLYWIVSAALLLVWLARPDLVFASSPNAPQWLNSLFLVPAYAYPLLEVGWTLVYEMMFYILFAGLLLLPRRIRPWGALVWAGLVLIGNRLGWQSASATAFHLFSPLVLEFIAGAAMGWIYLTVRGSGRAARLLSLIGLAGLLVWFISAQPFADQWPRVLRLTAPAAALVLGAAWLDREGASIPRALVWFGDISYSLYLTHLLTLVAIGKLWQLIGLSSLPSPLLIIVLIAGSVLVAALTYRWVEQPMVTAAKRVRRHLFARS